MHTPGPWDYSDQKGSRKHCYLGQVWDSNGESLAVLDSTTDPAVATANARLIAAAPELLSACELVISDSAVVSDNGKFATVQISSGVLDEVKAAIQKALGTKLAPTTRT